MTRPISILKSDEYFSKEPRIAIERGITEYSSSDRMHLHTYFTIDMVISGEGVHYINGKEYKLCKGAVHIVKPSDFHFLSADLDSRLAIFNIRFDESELSEDKKAALLNTYGELYIENNDFERLCVYAEALEEFLAKGNTEAARMLLNLIIITVTDISAEKNKAKEYDNSSVNKALRYIYANFRENPSLQEVADYVGLTPEYLSVMFKQALGKGYASFLSELKTNFACQALKGGFSVLDTCFLSGFGSVSNFNRVFKREIGVSPSDFKKEYRHSKKR